MNSFRPLRSLIIVLMICMLGGCMLFEKDTAPPEPLTDSSQIPVLLLDDKPFNPDPAPVMLDGKLYLPFIESLSLLNIPTESYPDQNAVIAYHHNRFLKIDTEKLSLSRNGKLLSKAQAPVLIKDTLFVSAELIFDTFSLGTSYPKDGVIAILHQDNADTAQLVDGEYYVPIEVKESDLQFSVPKSWNRMPGSPYRFGEKSEYDDYNVTFKSMPLDDRSDNELLFTLAETAAAENRAELSRDEVAPLEVNGLDGITATYHFDKDNSSGRMILYVFKRKEAAYVFQGWLNSSMDEQATLRRFTGIARSLRFGDMAVDIQSEHYIEAPAYFENGISLTSSLYSNMEVRGRLQLTGSLADRGIEWIHAVITRGDDTITQRIPVKDKQFSASVYTPFGLGKHDLTLYASKGDPTPQDRILQTSIVNVDALESRWMIPSATIDSDSEYITSQSSLLTYKTYGDYMKARQLFNWVVKNISIKSAKDQPDTASEVYLKSAGSEQEIAVLYAALLRATEIPARIVTGTGTETRTWVEMQMNGQWVGSDPVAAMNRMKGGAPLQEAADAHFNMSRAYFEERFGVIETMPW